MDLAARSNLRLLPRPPPGSVVASSFLSTTLMLLLGLRTSRLPPLRLLGTCTAVVHPLVALSHAVAFGVFSREEKLLFLRSRWAKGRIVFANNVFLLHHVASKLGITETEENISCNILSANNDVRISDEFSPREYAELGLRPSGS